MTDAVPGLAPPSSLGVVEEAGDKHAASQVGRAKAARATRAGREAVSELPRRLLVGLAVVASVVIDSSAVNKERSVEEKRSIRISVAAEVARSGQQASLQVALHVTKPRHGAKGSSGPSVTVWNKRREASQ